MSAAKAGFFQRRKLVERHAISLLCLIEAGAPESAILPAFVKAMREDVPREIIDQHRQRLRGRAQGGANDHPATPGNESRQQASGGQEKGQ